MKRKVLFVVRHFKKNAPQPIRFRQIIKYLSEDFDVHVLHMDTSDELDSNLINKITIHKLKYTFIGKLICTKPKNKTLLHKAFFGIFNLLGEKLLFPDNFTFEIKRVKNKVLELTKINKYDAIVTSSVPYSLMKIAELIKKKYPNTKFIHDIGDPLLPLEFGNSLTKHKKGIAFQQYFFQFIDVLVVTNNKTKDFYTEKFKSFSSKKTICVIPQGAYPPKINADPSQKGSNDSINLIYAGSFYKNIREPYELYKALEKSNNVVLNLFGNIKLPPPIEISNVIIHGSINFDQVQIEYMKNDALVFIDNKNCMQTPGKFYELLLIKKPILFIVNDEHSETLEEAKKFDHIFLAKNDFKNIGLRINELRSYILNNENVKVNIKDYTWEERANNYKVILSSTI